MSTDQSSSLFWFVIGIGITFSSLQYGFGSFHQPGPGFITFFSGVVLALLSLVHFISSFRNRKVEGRLPSLWSFLEIKKVFSVMILLAVYTLILIPAGFLISTFLLLLLLFRVKAAYRLRTIFIMSLLITIVSYVVFEIFLKVQLPKGILWWII